MSVRFKRRKRDGLTPYDVRQVLVRRRDALGRHLVYGVVRYAMRERGMKVPVACPCCGYLTITDQGFDVCSLCLWCDDGQDDPHADTVCHGANRSLSLSAARAFFHETLCAFSTEHELYEKEQLFKPDKLEVIALFDKLAAPVGNDEVLDLFRQVDIAVHKLLEKRNSMTPRS